ncbi:MAG: hypothetical protein GON13_01045 [Nanoarchaeota archaeon]|nr:hypothetical protein [Nanoarchaeota archaeon]
MNYKDNFEYVSHKVKNESDLRKKIINTLNNPEEKNLIGKSKESGFITGKAKVYDLEYIVKLFGLGQTSLVLKIRDNIDNTLCEKLKSEAALYLDLYDAFLEKKSFKEEFEKYVKNNKSPIPFALLVTSGEKHGLLMNNVAFNAKIYDPQDLGTGKYWSKIENILKLRDVCGDLFNDEVNPHIIEKAGMYQAVFLDLDEYIDKASDKNKRFIESKHVKL